MMLSSEIFGLPLPDAGPVFTTALVIHILCGLTAVIAGALAATARKRPGRHSMLDGSTCGRSAELSPLPPSRPLFAGTKTPTYSPSRVSLGLYGYQARRRHRPGWPPHHAIGMGGSTSPCSPALRRQGPFLPLRAPQSDLGDHDARIDRTIALTGEDPTVDLIVGLRRRAWFEVTPAQLLDRHLGGDWGCFAPKTSKRTSSRYKKASGSRRGTQICPRVAHLHTRTRMPTAMKVSSTAHHSASEGDTIARARR